jgi:hypothetical protein
MLAKTAVASGLARGLDAALEDGRGGVVADDEVAGCVAVTDGGAPVPWPFTRPVQLAADNATAAAAAAAAARATCISTRPSRTSW